MMNIPEILQIIETNGYAIPSEEVAKRTIGSELFEIVFPNDNELQLDIDDEASFAAFERVYELLINSISRDSACSYEIHPSKSGLPRRHITVTLPFDVDAVTRILLQACLGSDGRRELFGWIRYIAGDNTPSMFLELKNR